MKQAVLGGVCLLASCLWSLPPIAAQGLAGPNGIGFRAGGDALAVQLTARVQYDSRVFMDEGAGESDPIYLRRIAPGVQATLFRDYTLRVVADMSSGRPQPLDVSLSARFAPELQLRIGKVSVPVGLGRLQGGANASVVEHGLGSTLAPARDVGVEVRGTVGGMVDYSLGLFNGVPDSGNGPLEWSGEKDVVARGFLRPFARSAGHPLAGLGVGIGASSGRHLGDADDPQASVYRTGGREQLFRYLGGASPVVAGGLHRRLAPQGYLYVGSFGLMGEYLLSRAEMRRDDDVEGFSHRGWQMIGTWLPTGEKASYTPIEPNHPLDPGAGRWGALELAVRLDGFQADPDAFPRFADPSRSALSANSATGGVNWYPGAGIKVLVNYQVTRFGAAPGTEARTTERALVSRIQFGI